MPNDADVVDPLGQTIDLTAGFVTLTKLASGIPLERLAQFPDTL